MALIHLFTIAILWIYSTYFKNSLLIGNFLVAIAAAFIPLVYLVFEGIGYINLFKQSILQGPLKVLFNFSAQTFGILASGDLKKQVPICTAEAPSNKEAAMPLPMISVTHTRIVQH